MLSAESAGGVKKSKPQKMFTQRVTHLENILLSAVVLILTIVGHSATRTYNLKSTAAPVPSAAPSTTRNRSMEQPRIQRLHRPCGNEHANYCENGGRCMYPQDSAQPFCICASSYSGPRCLFFSVTDHTRSPAELEKLIAIGFGVAMLILVLVIVIYCIVYRRCRKSSPLIKSAPSESSV